MSQKKTSSHHPGASCSHLHRWCQCSCSWSWWPDFEMWYILKSESNMINSYQFRFIYNLRVWNYIFFFSHLKKNKNKSGRIIFRILDLRRLSLSCLSFQRSWRTPPSSWWWTSDWTCLLNVVWLEKALGNTTKQNKKTRVIRHQTWNLKPASTTNQIQKSALLLKSLAWWKLQCHFDTCTSTSLLDIVRWPGSRSHLEYLGLLFQLRSSLLL